MQAGKHPQTKAAAAMEALGCHACASSTQVQMKRLQVISRCTASR